MLPLEEGQVHVSHEWFWKPLAPPHRRSRQGRGAGLQGGSLGAGGSLLASPSFSTWGRDPRPGVKPPGSQPCPPWSRLGLLAPLTCRLPLPGVRTALPKPLKKLYSPVE